MRLNQLFKEDYRRGSRFPHNIDLDLSTIPYYLWYAPVHIPVTRGTNIEVWVEMRADNPNAIQAELRVVGVPHLRADKMMMHATLREKNYEIVKQLMFPQEPKSAEPTFHVDDDFSAGEPGFTIVIEHQNGRLLCYGLYEGEKTYVVYFKKPTEQALEKMFYDLLRKVNTGL